MPNPRNKSITGTTKTFATPKKYICVNAITNQHKPAVTFINSRYSVFTKAKMLKTNVVTKIAENRNVSSSTMFKQ